MKRLLFLIVISCLLCLSTEAQNKNDRTPFNLGIIPTPQQVTLTEGDCGTNLYICDQDSPSLKKQCKQLAKKNHATLCYTHIVDSIEGAHYQLQAYKIVVGKEQIDLYATTQQGMEYAMNTLQKLAHRRCSIPCMTIIDWPAFEYRGWLDDISRGPVPNSNFVAREVSTLSKNYKMNFFNLYTEHTFYNKDMPDIAPSENGLTTAIQNLSFQYMLNLQCLAHFEKTLRIPFYQDIMDTRYNVNPGTEKTYEFLKSQIDNMATKFPQSKFFNINCDETEGLGSGRARAYVDSMGAEEAYCRHINRVYDLIKPYNKEVLMWGDIVGKNPAMMERLPKDMQYIMWSYVPTNDFTKMLAPFQELKAKYGTQFWVAPGVSHWSTLVPSQHNYIANIAYLARDGYLAGARGLMNTAWDDSGESLFGDCWHAMAWAAEMSWNPIKNTDPELARKELAERERVFNENYDWWMQHSNDHTYYTLSFTKLFYAVGDLQTNPWVGDWGNTRALEDPLFNFYPSKVDSSILIRCDSVEATIERILHQFNLPGVGEKDSMLPGMETSIPHVVYALHRIQLTVEKSRLRVAMYRALQAQNADLTQVRQMAQGYFKRLHELKKEYLLLWDDECTEYSRNIICDRFDQLGREVLEIEQHVFISTQAVGGKHLVTLRTLGNRPIYYTLDGRQPSAGSSCYSAPFPIEHSCEIKAVSYNEWGDGVETGKYLLLHKGMGHLQKLNTQYSTYNDVYSGGGNDALLDGELGSDNSYADGNWQGYWGPDIDVEIDLGGKTEVNQITMRFLQNSTDWILSPQEIQVYISPDGKTWTLSRTEHFDPDFRQKGNVVHTDAVRGLKLQTRYLRVVAKNAGKLPDWAPGKGYDSYLFCDEIVVE